MEDVLDVYERPHDVAYPVVCLDEKPCQLIKDVLQPVQPKAGRVKREDSEYERFLGPTAAPLGPGRVGRPIFSDGWNL